MRKFITLFALFATLAVATSCSDDDDRIYISASGNGSLTVDYSQPNFLYRMVFFDNVDDEVIYLMGNSAFVDADAQFGGRGAVVKIVMPAQSEDTEGILSEQTFSIDGTDYLATYTDYVNYMNAENESDFIEITAGTVVIRRSGRYYELRLLGEDAEGDSVICSYNGYIYRSFYESGSDEGGDEELSRY